MACASSQEDGLGGARPNHLHCCDRRTYVDPLELVAFRLCSATPAAALGNREGGASASYAGEGLAVAALAQNARARLCCSEHRWCKDRRLEVTVESRYVLGGVDAATEEGRLALLERRFDPGTIRRLVDLGVVKRLAMS